QRPRWQVAQRARRTLSFELACRLLGRKSAQSVGVDCTRCAVRHATPAGEDLPGLPVTVHLGARRSFRFRPGRAGRSTTPCRGTVPEYDSPRGTRPRGLVKGRNQLNGVSVMAADCGLPSCTSDSCAITSSNGKPYARPSTMFSWISRE